MLDRHRHAPAAKAEFLLSGKLFCGECKSQFVGTSGKGRTGEVYYYYACNSHLKKKNCSMPNFSKEDIEHQVLSAVLNCIDNDEFVEQIAEDCVRLQENDKNQELDALLARRRTAESALNNLVAAVEILQDPALLQRISERRAEIADLDAAILTERKLDFKVTADQIKVFLRQFAKGDINDPEYCRRIINTFVNKVFVFKDKPPIIALNATGKKAQVSLEDIPSVSDFATDGQPYVVNAKLFFVSA